jgi:hypothetical protein
LAGPDSPPSRRLPNSVAAIYITLTTDTTAGLPAYQHVQADALLTGGEASFEVDVASSVTLSGRLDGVRATNQRPTPPPLTAARIKKASAEFH